MNNQINQRTVKLRSANEADTRRIGQFLAEHIGSGIVVALSGTLGAGKTRLVQAVGAHWGVDPRDIVSPTFTLCTTHQGEREFFHIDAYRLVDDDQWLELGFDELIDDGKMVLIEWAEKFEHLLPADRLNIEIEIVDQHTRDFWIQGGDQRSNSIVDSLAVDSRAESLLADG